MSKILLAIDNELVFSSIIENRKKDFFEKDIVYKEGVIEVLEKNPEINFVIVNSNICGEIKIEDFIIKLKEIRENIKIIIYINKSESDKINFFNSNGIYQIYYLEDLNLRNISEVIENIFYEDIKINNEINRLKNLLLENKMLMKKDSKVIIFLGERNTGKTIFSTTFAQIVEKQNQKVILISLDVKKFDISILLNCEKIINKKIKINTMLDILYITNIEDRMIENLKREYDYIIIDSSKCEEKVKYIFINNARIIFIIEPSILGINKANLILEDFFNNYKLDVEEIEIIFNRFDKSSLSKFIIKELFKKYKIIGFCKNGKIKKFIKNKLMKGE